MEEVIILWALKSKLFSEIDYDNLDELRGMDITIVTTARDDKQGLELLKSFNLPINI